MAGKRAVFLDRDGTINEEVEYLSDIEKLVIYPGAARAVRMINESGMATVVVTNQSGIARGYFDEAFVQAVHERIQEIFRAEGALIDRFYYCPHHPDEGRGTYLKDCDCRKPNPGMLLKAAEELDLDLARSYMIGDTMKDVETAHNAGVRAVLVTTGHGGSGESSAEPIHVASSLLEAVRWILSDMGGGS